MRRRLFCLILAAVMCIAAAASAELTFAQTCKHKLSGAVTLYTAVDGEENLVASTDQLAAGTYVIPNGTSREGKTGITYGWNLYGYVDGSAIVSAVATVTVSGQTITVPEKLLDSQAALNLWLKTEGYETTDSNTYTDENGVTHELGSEGLESDDGEADGDAIWSSAMSNAYAKNGGSTATTYRDDQGNQIPVSVSYMGLTRSMVTLNGEEQLVETWRLSWATEAEEDQVLAVVTPKDAAEVRFWEKESSKAKILGRVPTTRVVRVIKVGKTWTLVDLDDPEMPRGYIYTDVLTFYPNEKRDYTPGKITGCTKDDPVKVRETENGRRITYQKAFVTFGPGEPLSIIEKGENWTEAEIGGYHVFIMSQFVAADETAVSGGI